MRFVLVCERRGIFISLEAPDQLLTPSVMEFMRLNLLENVLPSISPVDFNDSFLHYAVSEGLPEGKDLRSPQVGYHIQIALRWDVQLDVKKTLEEGTSVLFSNYIYESMPKDETYYFEQLKMQKGLLKPDLSICFVQEENVASMKSLYAYDSSISVLNVERLINNDLVGILKHVSQITYTSYAELMLQRCRYFE